MDANISYPDNGHATCFQVEDYSFWFRHRNECISALVAKYMDRGCFADVGGGNGYVARRLQDDGLDVTLIEPGSEGANNARSRGIRRVECCTLKNASSGPFQAIGAFDVAEHIRDDAEFVGEVADRLVSGGYFFATVPAYTWLWSGADDEAGHFRRYTRNSFSTLLAERFDVLFASYFFVPLLPPIALMRALPYLLGRRVGDSAETTARNHKAGGGATMMGRILAREVGRIRDGSPMSIGASLIVAARKRS